jgi:Zn-dependent peptidase ImmA (M78 family)
MRGRTSPASAAKRALSQSGFDAAKVDINKPRSCVVDVESVAERYAITIVPHEFSEDISGVFFRKGSRLYLGVNKSHHENRRRFTIAHEIGHYLLHSTEPVHYDLGTDLSNVYFRASDISSSEEVQANRFAAELLMPPDLVSRCIKAGIVSIDELSSRFQVSTDAMRYRLINLGYL